MRRATVCSAALLIAASGWSQASLAQLDLSGIKMAEPSPELPGDRAMSCAKIGDEISEIMSRRGMKQKVASSRNKLCSSKREMDRLGEERKKLSATQAPALTTAAIVGGPVAQVVTRKTQAEDAALEAKQRPDRDRALAGVGSGIGDIMSVMNDPRLMRLTMLAQDKRCAESMAPPKQDMTPVAGDGCDDVADTSGALRAPSANSSPAIVEPVGPADPFAKR